MNQIVNRLEEIFNNAVQDDEIGKYSSEEMVRYFSFLEDYSQRNKLSLCLVNKHTLHYEYRTQGFYDLWQVNEGEVPEKVPDLMASVFDNPADFVMIMQLNEKVLCNFDTPEKFLFTTTFCGVKTKTFTGKPVKLLSHNIPLKLDGEWQHKIHFCENRDVSHLFDSDHFWVRFVICGEVFHYLSTYDVLYRKEILSKSELTCVAEWASGLGLNEIASKLFISLNTVKNHLKAARNKLGARDNTALVELCKFAGIL